MKIIFLSLFCFFPISLVHSGDKLTAESPEVKHLLPYGATICKSEPILKAQIGKHQQRGWYSTPQSKEEDCVLTSDLDNDGKDELVIVYSTPTKDDSPQNYLDIYKKAKYKWILQYHHGYGSVIPQLGVLNLVNTKMKQIVFTSGWSASIGYGLFVIQYNGKEYKSIISEKEDNTGFNISLYDIDGNKQKEILAHRRFAPLATVFKWNDKTRFFEVLTDTNSATMRNYYKLVVATIKTPLESDGRFNDGYAWALFESYDKLGDSSNAISIGKQMMEYFNDVQIKEPGTGYAWYGPVKDRLNELESSK